MTTLHDRIAATPEGERVLAAGRLKYEISKAQARAFTDSGLTAHEIAARLDSGIYTLHSAMRQIPEAVGRLAEYLHACGYELKVELVPAGTASAEVLAHRATASAVDGDA